MLGQIRVEFIFGIIIFALVMFFIVTQTNTLFSSLLTDSRSDALKAKALDAIKILVEDKGDPPSWNDIPSSTKRVGLAEQPYFLSKSKVLTLNSNCTITADIYKNLLWNFDLKAYRLKVYNSTHQLLFCGYDSLEPVNVMETRYVYIDGGYGRITLEMW